MTCGEAERAYPGMHVSYTERHTPYAGRPPLVGLLPDGGHPRVNPADPGQCVGLSGHTSVMGIESPRRHARGGRLGGTNVGAYTRFTDRPAPRRRRGHSLHYPGSRSASIMPTLWALGALLGGVILVLVVLVVTHMDAPVERTDAPAVPSSVVPAKPAVPPAPPEPCFPFQGPC